MIRFMSDTRYAGLEKEMQHRDPIVWRQTCKVCGYWNCNGVCHR